MKVYLKNLLEEKGITSSIENEMNIEGHFGLTYEMQIDFICNQPAPVQKQIRMNFVKIDFLNGDVNHFWKYLTDGMLKSLGY